MERFVKFCENELGTEISLRVDRDLPQPILLHVYSKPPPVVLVVPDVIVNRIHIEDNLRAFLKNPTPENAGKIGVALENIRQKQKSEIEHENQPAPKRDTLIPEKGRFVRLGPVFEKVNRKYFGGKLEVRITWGRRREALRRSSIQWACYDFAKKEVRINPVLDRPGVPPYVLEFLVYHELLHAYCGVKRKNGRCRYHDERFSSLEKSHPSYKKAEKWFESNLHRFFKNRKPPSTRNFFEEI